uniref:Activating signal cointegrator 1 complex subunit 1-like n=1 Tax=Diabrotica virgifera virgifera TaxID=50390 RepID=A0A6P7G2M0_DIAVI
MYQETTRRDFPDFFTEKGPLQLNVTPINFGNSTYWMSSLACKQNEGFAPAPLRPYEDNDTGLLDCQDMENDYEITLNQSGKYVTSFYVPSSLLPYIIGAKASRLKSLERSTNTQIKVPRPNEKGNVKIMGEQERKVASARTQISLIVNQRKEKLPISHFVSIPMVSDSVKAKILEFKENILKDPARGISDSIFLSSEKLHLTISTLTLLDDEEITTAKKVLRNCYEEIISKAFPKNRTYSIHMKGIEIMNDDPSSVNVLYGNVEMDDQVQSQNLQYIANNIADYFAMSGLAKRQYDRVKLHVTIMNSRYRKPEEKQESFDAEDILKKYKDFYFGVVEFRSIHLSVRFTRTEGYYEDALVIKL